SRRPAFAARPGRGAPGLAARPVPDPERARQTGRAHAVGRRAADAGDRARADDATAPADPRRADAWPGTGDPGAAVQGAGAAAPDARHDGAARGAERHLRAAARRPRVRAGARADRLGRRPGALRAGGGDGVFVSRLLIPRPREYDSPRHREPPLGGVAIQGHAAGICHAALDRHGAARLAMTGQERLPLVPSARWWTALRWSTL